MDSDKENDDGSKNWTASDELEKYFEVKPTTKLVHCNVRNCETTFKSKKTFNLKRHLRKKHPSIFSKLNPSESNERKRLEILSLGLIFDSVEFVTINGMPISLLDASAIKGFCKKSTDELNAKGFNVNLDRNTIANRVDEISKEIMDILKTELEGRDICLMLDTCTKGTLSTMSINSQYMIDDKIIVRSLGVIELTMQHTAVQLTKEIQEYLQRVYNVSITQVKGVVTGNAENMFLTRKLINKLARGECFEQFQNANESEDSDEEYETSERHPSTDDDFDVMNKFSNNNEYLYLVRETASEFVKYYGSIFVANSISCSAYTYQLAIKDSLIVTNATEIVNQAYDLCKLIRTQAAQEKLKQLSVRFINPPLKNATRWNSDYLMVISFCLYNV